jgi:hypothetical protein
MLQLTVHLSGSEAVEHRLTRPVVTIGRSPDNDVIIPSHGVAPRHARLVLTPQGDAYRLEALEAVLGTYVNGQQIQAGILEPGDRIRFGSVDATVADDRFDPDPAALRQADAEALRLARLRIVELEAGARGREMELSAATQELAARSGELARVQGELHQARTALVQAEHDHRVRESEWARAFETQNAQLAQEAARRDALLADNAQLQARIEELDRRLRELDESARKRIQRGHEAIAALRKKTTQQEGELREARYEIMKLRRGKEASDTLLESMKRCYARNCSTSRVCCFLSRA